nr:60S ribosomal protein L34 [Tanacetum cinerariifolium]
DKPDVGESSQPCGKELEINSDDEDVGKQFKLVDGVIYLEFDPKLPWNEMKPTLGLRDLAEGRSDGKKGKKGDWSYKKEKDEDELPKKDKGKLLREPKKEHTCSRNFELGSLVTFKWIAKQFAFKIIQDPTITYRYIQEQIKKKYLINVSVGQCKRAKQRALFDNEGPSVADSIGPGTQTITEDPIVADPTDDISTQQSKTSDTAKIIEDAIETGRLKIAGIKKSWGSSISSDSFLPSILLLVVIIVTVVIVVVILIVVVLAIAGVVIFVVDGVSSIFKLSFMIIGVSLCLVFLLGLSIFAMVTACASKAAAIPSKTLDDKLGYPFMIISRDEHLTHSVPQELVYFPIVVDGDTGIDDSTRVSTSLGGEITLREKIF